MLGYVVTFSTFASYLDKMDSLNLRKHENLYNQYYQFGNDRQS